MRVYKPGRNKAALRIYGLDIRAHLGQGAVFVHGLYNAALAKHGGIMIFPVFALGSPRVGEAAQRGLQRAYVMNKCRHGRSFFTECSFQAPAYPH